MPFTVTNSGTETVHLTLWIPDLVKTIFAVSDSKGFFNKTIKQHIIGPGMKKTHTHVLLAVGIIQLPMINEEKKNCSFSRKSNFIIH